MNFSVAQCGPESSSYGYFLPEHPLPRARNLSGLCGAPSKHRAHLLTFWRCVTISQPRDGRISLPLTTYPLPAVVTLVMQGSLRLSSASRAISCTSNYRLGLVRTTHRFYSASTSGSALPSSFLSLYRLFLRSTAASVLSQPEATSLLRKQWRPVFSQAAVVMRQLSRNDVPPEQRQALTHWLTEWEKRGQFVAFPTGDPKAHRPAF